MMEREICMDVACWMQLGQSLSLRDVLVLLYTTAYGSVQQHDCLNTGTQTKPCVHASAPTCHQPGHSSYLKACWVGVCLVNVTLDLSASSKMLTTQNWNPESE